MNDCQYVIVIAGLAACCRQVAAIWMVQWALQQEVIAAQAAMVYAGRRFRKRPAINVIGMVLLILIH